MKFFGWLALILLFLYPAESFSSEPDVSLYESGYKIPAPLNLTSVKSFLKTSPITGPEGIWGFEPDEITLLILKDMIMPGEYGIFVIDAVDSRLQPGQRIGTLKETIDDNTYHISLLSKWKDNRLNTPLKGTATIDTKRDIMKIEGKSAKISISPNIILPNLLGLLRMRVRINLNNPESKIPAGLRKIYPTSCPLPIYL